VPAPAYLQYPFANMQGQQVPVYYAPVQFAQPQVQLQAPVEASEKKGWGCKRSSWCQRREGGCCLKDDGRELGNQTHFAANLAFGSLLPFFSLLVTFGMETSKLARLGVIFGHANFFFTLAAGILAYSRHHHHGCGGGLIVPVIFGVIFLIVSLCHWKRFVWTYATREKKTDDEVVKSSCVSGRCRDSVIGFLVSFIFPFIGTAIILIARRKVLRSRYGALLGFGFSLIVCGVHTAFHGVPPVALVAGLVLVQFSAVHFRRAIMWADANQLPTTN